MQSEAFSVGSSDKIAFRRVTRDEICKNSKISVAKENILCTEDVSSLTKYHK